jgi:selenocysteine lyase/cysteine desulfurase
MNRRDFLGGATTLAAASPPSAQPQASPPDFSKLRADFPRALNETYFNSAAQHPLGNHTVRGMYRYIEFLAKGPGEGREDFWETGFREVKPMFAKLINAKPSEIALCGSTTIGENILLNGIDLTNGNVVTNDFHYTSSLANYLQRKNQGLDVRIVKHRDWHIDLADMERATTNKTKLIAVSLVSSVNGHVEKIKALSDLAHSHGALLFADIIQGTGAFPVDVRAMGIDLASCAMYKWLQGEHGFGFMYIREDLIGKVVKPTELTGHVEFNYAPWSKQPDPKMSEFVNQVPSGIAAFECGTPSVITYAAQYESFRYIARLGVENIQSHAQRLIKRLRKELPQRDYACITPEHAGTPLITFRCRDTEETRQKIRRAGESGKARISITGPNSALTVGRFGDHLRISVSIFNNDDDVSKIIEVLS